MGTPSSSGGSSLVVASISSTQPSMATSKGKKKKGRRNKKYYKHDDPQRQRTRSLFQKAKTLERGGQWREASALLSDILEQDPTDAHSHLALARLEARREQTSAWQQSSKSLVESNARRAFQQGTIHCPSSVHLWQAWAKYEAESWGNTTRARELFETALEFDAYNPYVCHAYGLMEKKEGRVDEARELWERALKRRSTAALVCSLGELLTGQKQYNEARALYEHHVPSRLTSERERSECYLAWAWLEERHFQDADRAEELIQLALLQSPGDSRAQLALARLDGRHKKSKNAAVRRLASACLNMDNAKAKDRPTDGRLFNAWAHLEVKSRNFSKARKILQQGIKQFPNDQSLYQAAGKVEERTGNFTGAKQLYSSSLGIEPSAPALVAYAMLELRDPESKLVNYTRIERLFEEALLVDPRHGPAYNAYGNMELRRGRVDEARNVYKRGVAAQCSDAASVFHGLAKLELSQGNVDLAREILAEGIRKVEAQQCFMDTSKSERATFLAHTLGMLELNSNRAKEGLSAFQDGIDRHGNSSQLLLGAALCEIKLGKEESARKYFERSVDADKEHAQAFQAWGCMEMKAGNYTKATHLFEVGIKNVPTYGALWHAYATMAGRLAQSDKARV
jgi:tetratricopeptide (TPR) repeat protein